MTDHEITPPPELVRQWTELPLSQEEQLIVAACWGADQELEACIEVILSYPGLESPELFVEVLRAARRPPTIPETIEVDGHIYRLVK